MYTCIDICIYLCPSNLQDLVVEGSQLRFSVLCIRMNVVISIHIYIHSHILDPVWVATVSRIDKITGMFCRISSLLEGSFAKETYNLIDPTTRSHPIVADCKLRYPGICVCINICIYVSMYLSTCIESYIRRGQSFVYVYMYVCIYLFTYTRPCSRRGQTTLPSHMRIYKCIHVCMYMSVHIHRIL